MRYVWYKVKKEKGACTCLKSIEPVNNAQKITNTNSYHNIPINRLDVEKIMSRLENQESRIKALEEKLKRQEDENFVLKMLVYSQQKPVEAPPVVLATTASEPVSKVDFQKSVSQIRQFVGFFLIILILKFFFFVYFSAL